MSGEIAIIVTGVQVAILGELALAGSIMYASKADPFGRTGKRNSYTNNNINSCYNDFRRCASFLINKLKDMNQGGILCPS